MEITRESTANGRRLIATATDDAGRLQLTVLASDDQGVRVGSLQADFDTRDAPAAAELMSAVLGSATGTARAGRRRGRKDHWIDDVRRRHPNAYRPWTDDDDGRLTERYRAGSTVQELIGEFGRNRGGIQARLELLGLLADRSDGPAQRVGRPGDDHPARGVGALEADGARGGAG
jgi:hypothetical protein